MSQEYFGINIFREYIPKLASWVQNHAQLFVRNKTFFYGWNCSFNPELFFIFNFFGMYFLSCARHCVCLMFFFITITMFKFICESIIVKAVVHNISFHCFIMYLGFIGNRDIITRLNKENAYEKPCNRHFWPNVSDILLTLKEGKKGISD